MWYGHNKASLNWGRFFKMDCSAPLEDPRACLPYSPPQWTFTTSSFSMSFTPRVYQLASLNPPHQCFRYVQFVGVYFKVSIPNHYGILLLSCLEGWNAKCYNAKEKWEQNVGLIDDELWDNVLESILHSSLNTAQRLPQLYIMLCAHYTLLKLHCMDILRTHLCTKCTTMNRDLIHLL